jgi:hypothetical protein
MNWGLRVRATHATELSEARRSVQILASAGSDTRGASLRKTPVLSENAFLDGRFRARGSPTVHNRL